MADARLPVSVLLLVRDETRDVQELLPQLGFAAEVVAVCDAAGDPAARASAEALGARVFVRALDGFGPQRAFALAQCREPWVLWLDADERLAPGALEALRECVADAACDGLWCVRRTWFLGGRIRFCGWRDEWLLRLFKRERAAFDDAFVHERLQYEPRAARRDARAVIEHHSYRTWDDCVRKQHAYAEANARQAHRAGKRASLLDVWLRPPLRFVRQYVLQLGILDGWRGLVLCGFAAAQVGEKYARLRDLSQVPR